MPHYYHPHSTYKETEALQRSAQGQDTGVSDLQPCPAGLRLPGDEGAVVLNRWVPHHFIYPDWLHVCYPYTAVWKSILVNGQLVVSMPVSLG